MNDTKILKGKPVADNNMIYCHNLINEFNLSPHLYVILVGDDPASEYYVNSIIKQAKKYNVNITLHKSEEITERELLDKIQTLNNDSSVHGIMVQKPLPKHINPAVIEQMIIPDKDVDGFHALNAGLLLQEKECFLPCTAQAILEILDYYNISPESKHVVVVGRSNVVGKPVANLLLYKEKNRNATVSVCHSRTPDLSVFTLQADILITAVGIANLIDKNMIKENVIILDAGINELISAEGKISYCGDVNYDSCFEKSMYITPVPGVVGSVTTSILFKHLCDSAKKIKILKKVLTK